MANKSFVVQYLIKARDQFSLVTDKASASMKKMQDQQKKVDATLAAGGAARNKFIAQTHGQASALDKLKLKISSLNKEQILGGMKSAGKAGLVLTAAVTTPLLYLAKGLKDAARDGVETRSKFKAVFSSIGGDAEASADRLSKSYMLAGVTSRDMMANTGDILTGFGFSQKAALALSEQVSALSVDLVSFKNYSGGATGASEALTKAMLGERESLKSLGIAILDEDVKAEVRLLVKKGLHFATKRQADAYATLSLATKQAKNAIGDLARTKNQLANLERAATERTKEASEMIGNNLIPAFTLLAKAQKNVADWFLKLSPSSQKAMLAIAGVVAVIPVLLVLLGGIALAAPIAASGIGLVSAATMFLGKSLLKIAAMLLLNPIGLIITGIAVSAYLIYKNWSPIKKWFIEMWDSVALKAQALYDKIMLMVDAVVKLKNAAKDFFTGGDEFANKKQAAMNVLRQQGASNADITAFQFRNNEAEMNKILAPTANINNKVNVGVDVRLAKGLEQANKPVVGTSNQSGLNKGSAYAGAY